jgi:hypothetical protein
MDRDRALKFIVAGMAALGAAAEFVLDDNVPPPSSDDLQKMVAPFLHLADEVGVDPAKLVRSVSDPPERI